MPFVRRFALSLLAGPLFMFSSTVASAATHQVTLHARVASDFGSLSAGDTFNATFAFDPSLPNTDLAPGNPNWGIYYDALSAGTISIGGQTWTQKTGGYSSLQVSSTPDESYLQFAFEVTGPQQKGLPPDLFVLQGKAVSLFSSDSMPSGSMNDSDFDYMIGSLNFGSMGAVAGWGKWKESPFTDTSFSISAVPEPSTYALFAAGGLMLFGMSRRRPSAPLHQDTLLC